jgi:hypothetical protein
VSTRTRKQLQIKNLQWLRGVRNRGQPLHITAHVLPYMPPIAMVEQGAMWYDTSRMILFERAGNDWIRVVGRWPYWAGRIRTVQSEGRQHPLMHDQ